MLLVMGSLYATDAQENQNREILRIGNGLNVSAVWRHDQSIFARVVDNKEVHFYSPDGEWLNSISLTDDPKNTSIKIFWSPDDTHAAFKVTTCPDGESCSEHFSVWNISKDGRTTQLIFTDESGDLVTWKPDSQQVAFGGRIYDAATGEIIHKHLYGLATWDSSTSTYSIAEYNHGPGGPIVWSPDGRQYVGIDYALIHGQAYAIFLDNGLVIPLNESYTDLRTPQFHWSPDGKLLTDGYRAWDAQTGALLSRLHDGDNVIGPSMLSDVDGFWHPESNLIYTLYHSMMYMPYEELTTLYVWNPQIGEPSHVQSFYRYIRKLFWRGNELLATADDNWELTLNPETGAVTSAKPLDILITPDSLAWSPDSSKLVIASDGVPNFPLQVWDIAAMQVENQSEPLWTVHNDWFAFETEAAQYGTGGVEVRWTPDGNEIVTLATDYTLSRMFNAVERWRVEDGQSAGRIAFETTYIMPLVDPSPDLQRSARYFSMMVSNNRVEILDGTEVVSVLHLYDDETSGSFIQTAWKPDGKQLAVSAFLESETMQIWDVASNPPQLIQSIEHGSYPEWSSTGRYLVTQGTVYDPTTGRVILEAGIPHRYYQPVIVWNPGDTFFTFRAEDEIQFWNMTTQQIIERVPVEDGCCVPRAWSPDGTMLALTAEDGTIRIWNVSGFSK